jgi:excisionase family DNA binding protein
VTDFALSVPDEAIERLADAVAKRLSVDRAEPAPQSDGKLAVSIAEAADLLGVSADHFRRHVLPDLRIVRSGRLRLIPVAELEGWLDRTAARALTGAPLAHGNGSPHGERDRNGAQGCDPGAGGRDDAE